MTSDATWFVNPTNGKDARGLVIWTGQSLFDDSPILLIATFISRNEKTGDMIQTWILKRDVSPVHAIHTGSDRSVCGDCQLRGIRKRKDRSLVNRRRGCYVNVEQAPQGVWHAYQRGSYPYLEDSSLPALRNHVRGRPLRMGSYGEPVAVPIDAWRPLFDACDGFTGYTHAWRNTDVSAEWRRYLMASVESERDALEAQALGWQTFRIRSTDEPLLPGELVCPASEEGKGRTQCARCLRCNGCSRNVTIIGHGSPATLSSLARIRGVKK